MSRYIGYDKFAEKHCCCGYFDEVSEDELKKFIAPDVVEAEQKSADFVCR